MSIDINKRTKGNYFWSGECLMQNNDNGTFSSYHVLDIGEIKPNEHQKKFIVTACNNYDKLIEALKETIGYISALASHQQEQNKFDTIIADRNKFAALLNSIEKDNKDC